VSCGELTTRTWFCLACCERGSPHIDDDPYDDLGGEAGALS
jgi:hypothetical protein